MHRNPGSGGPPADGGPTEPLLSLIIPAYREERRLGPTLSRLEGFLRDRIPDHEIIVVDDGSDDGTAVVAEEWVRADPSRRRLLRHPVNAGKGRAVATGVEAARGRHVLFTDADLPYRLEAIPRALEAFRTGADLVIGGRDLPGSVAEVEYPAIRRLWSRGYSYLIRWFLMSGIPDTQCGLKAFRREVARDVFSHLSVPGFGFDVEILFVARRKGYDIRRIPVTMVHSEGSKVRLLGDSARMFVDLFRIRLNALRGRYGVPGGRVDQVPGDYQHRALHEGNSIQRSWHRNRVDLVGRLLRPSPGEFVLDAGCGSAIAARACGNAVYVGIDLNRKSLAFGAATYPGAAFARAALLRLPFRDGAFDKALMVEVLEHLPEAEAKAAVMEVFRVLRPGGLLLVTTPNPRSAWPAIERAMDALHLAPRMAGDQHVQKVDRQELARLLHPFVIERQGTFNLLSPFAAPLLGDTGADLLHRLEVRLGGGAGNLLFALAHKPATPRPQP